VCLGSRELCGEVVEALKGDVGVAFVIASTKTSTIPGISAAGASPQATLLTPTLDVEYVYCGRPLSADLIPVTPEGLPTPAVISRACLNMLRLPYLIVDAGAATPPKVPHVTLPGRVVGGRIDLERALPEGRSQQLFRECEGLGSRAFRGLDALVIGESLPGGTTTAAAILTALGVNAVRRVSSSSPNNPVGLKESVVRAALNRSGIPEGGVKDPFLAADMVGDPLHPSVAGLALGALKAGVRAVLLAGGTQMVAALAILRMAAPEDILRRVAVGTTRWIVEDRQSSIESLLRDVSPSTPLLHTSLSFRNSPYSGLRMYEEGYVKEGVGAGGLAVTAEVRGFDAGRIAEEVYGEYRRLLSLGAAKA